MKTYELEIEALESEWSPEHGFFWQIRRGHFATTDFQRALGKLSTMSIHEDATVPRRLVSLLWWIPRVMEWQVERVRETGGDAAAYETAMNTMSAEIERLLGIP